MNGSIVFFLGLLTVFLISLYKTFSMSTTVVKNIKHIHKPYNGTLIISVFDNHKIKFNMAISQTVLQKSTVVISTVDRKGQPTPIDGSSFVAESSDPAIFSVAGVNSPDGINFEVEVVSEGVGVAQLNISADADLGEGVVPISGFAAVEILPELAVGFGGFTQTNVQDK